MISALVHVHTHTLKCDEEKRGKQSIETGEKAGGRKANIKGKLEKKRHNSVRQNFDFRVRMSSLGT